MAGCVCGSKRFIAHQVWYVDVIVDENGDLLQELGENAVYDCGKPYGPYICVECGREYNELPG